jgi:uncharacterized tellurite resistance protein B-like protein
MKTLCIFVLCFCVSFTVFAQADLPTKAEAARVIESLFHCIGNGDMENLSKYVTKEGIEEKFVDQCAVISESLDETQKKEYIAFKANIMEMRPIRDRATNTVFVRCFLAKNSLSGSVDLVKENGAWKLR